MNAGRLPGVWEAGHEIPPRNGGTEMNNSQHPHLLEGRLEPECRDVQTPMECAALSIAISLKRIADQLSGEGSAPRDKTSLSDVLNALPFFLNITKNEK